MLTPEIKCGLTARETDLSEALREIEKRLADEPPETYKPAQRGLTYNRPVVDPDRPHAERKGWHSLGADPALFLEHLQAQEAVHSEEVEAAVQVWAKSGRPPLALEGEAAFHLLLRLSLATQVVAELIKLEGESSVWPSFPDPRDSQQFIIWALIDTWGRQGSDWLNHYAAASRKDVDAVQSNEPD